MQRTPASGKGSAENRAAIPARASIPAEILAYARAAYPQRRSSNANSLQSQNSAGFPQSALASAPLCLIRHVGWNKIPSGVSREATTSSGQERGIKAVFNVTAMERSILAELFERGGRGQLSGLRDRRPTERLVNKGFVERHTLNSQQEEYVLTAIGKKVLDNK